MRNNRGFSLIEIILVIAILGLLSGVSVNAFNHVKFANTKKCAALIDKAMDEVRMDTLSKSEKPYLYVYNYNSVYYLKISKDAALTPGSGLDGSGRKIGNQELTISYETILSSISTATDDLNSGDFIRLSYKRGTGAFEGTDDTCSGSCMTAPCPFHPDKIMISGNQSYTINIARLTGRHFMN